MKYQKITNKHLTFFTKIIGDKNVISDKNKLENYSHDETEDLKYFPEIVLKPSKNQEVSKILSFCNKEKIPVTTAGARTGLSGGALPIFGGVVLSMERFNKILEIDEKNLQAIVEPGVINQVFQDAVKEKNLFYPPDPASKGSCFLGGNLAESAGGPKAVKYGTTKDYVLNLEIVLADGNIIWTGANVLKNATGYNLTQLIIGSEGTLGVITKIVFRLIPLPKFDLLMMANFTSAEKACKAVSAIFRAGITPSALEFMERVAVEYAIKYTDSDFEIKEETNAFLLIEVDGNYLEQLYLDCEKISEVLEKFGSDDVLFAEASYQKEKLWQIRRTTGLAVKSQSIYKEEDTVVSRFELPKLLNGVKEIGKKYGFESVCYGHAGDGNLHINILKGDLSNEIWNKTIKKGIAEIFELTKNLGGTISGEHGIGLVQKEFMPIVYNEVQMTLMKKIKKVFDPNFILNPGKIFPD